MPIVDKLIVTHRGALATKYGKGLSRIDAAVKELVKADAKRGLTTRFVALDDAAALGRRHVARPTDERGCKDAIDHLARSMRPDYLMILGAPDVIPHQRLHNTKHDGDPGIPSDLPYACDEPFTRDPRQYIAPTRVIGRLPDVTGSSDPAYLVALLRRAARYDCRPRSDYEEFFGLSAQAWRDSTVLSLTNVFGTRGDLRTSPPQGPRWSRSLLRRRVHFINCHGAAGDPTFYGQGARALDQPEAMTGRRLEHSAVREATVVAAECCYGADLFDPQGNAQRGICYVYLAEGCYGFFGSTCTAYGPEEGNGQADLICQYFLDRVLRGASLGRAALEAQLRFVQACSTMQPEDMKTLAQFVLLGDPSVQPVGRAKHGLADMKAFDDVLGDVTGRRHQRLARRIWMLRVSEMVRQTVGKASLPGPFGGGPRLRRVLRQLATSEPGTQKPVLSSYRVTDPVGERMWRRAGGSGRGTFVHTATAQLRRKRGAVVDRFVSVVATVRGGQVVALRRLYSR